MASVKDFYLGARPKTLSAAVSPVAIGSALSYLEDSKRFDSIIALACLIVAFALQIGVNYANDYSDGKKGTDENRVGPMRLVGSGTASANSVLVATCISFLVAAAAGIFIASQSSWWMVVVGAICITLAWFYTGGKYPYGYFGFGELVVFICFGFVATVGTFFAISNTVTWQSLIAGCIPGFYSVAILITNNIRDIKTDRESGKKTLASRIGEQYSRNLLAASFFMIGISTILLAMSIAYLWFGLLLLIPGGFIVKKMYNATKPPEYIEILVETSKLNLASGLVIAGLIVLEAM